MRRRFLISILPIFSTIVLVITYFTKAGDLNPPAGPVAPTHKTLTEVEPRTAINATNTPGDADSLFKIIQPGSYYLTSNISGVAAKHGVEITASGVTLDLNGFDLVGVVGSLDAVVANVNGTTNIAVVNGSVRDWDGNGINVGAVGVFGGRIHNIHAHNNALIGIQGGNIFAISNCSARGNGSHGIAAFTAGSIMNCASRGNGSNGFNTTSGCVYSNCAAYDNTANGFSTGLGCTISHCAATTNTQNGIQVGGGSLVLSNCCLNNGFGVGDGAGILATSGDTRIEGNNCSGADRGIDVNAAGNIIVRNTCAGNTTNWDIVANNVCGPIVDRTAPASAAISGNSAPDSTGSTHPNANFSY